MCQRCALQNRVITSVSVGPFVFNNLVTNSPGLGSRTTRQPAPHHQTATMTNPPLRFLAGGTCEANARTTTRRCTSNRAAKSRCDNFSLRRATLISSNNSTFDNRLSPHHGHQKAPTARTTRDQSGTKSDRQHPQTGPKTEWQTHSHSSGDGRPGLLVEPSIDSEPKPFP